LPSRLAEIAAASQEQSSGIEQVNTAVTQMERVVQQNASLMEESTGAAESMKGQAGALLEMVARFKLGEQQSERAVSEPAAPRAATALAAPQLRPVTGNGDWKEF
jgi:methyl-accepting chemotaxis protein